eukprot:scaffold286_cov169-Amphora_coffeaeformis.AAC.18
MAMFRFLVSLVVLLGFLVPGAHCGCPPVDEPCMNEQNHQKCQELVDNGCTNLIWMESCPIQFACATYDRSNLRRTKAVKAKEATALRPDACVSLYVYDTDKCTGTPRRTVTYPTWQKPGSQCFHDVSMDHISVKDQYCNAETGNWHQTVFMGSADCSKKWWNSRFELTYTTDSCIGGYQLAECHLDPCSQTEPINDDKEVLESIVMAIAMAVD